MLPQRWNVVSPPATPPSNGRILNDMQLFKTYVGASLERGNVWQNSKDVSFGNTITAGSVFLGVDTPIGPLYLTYGHANTGDYSFYIYLGPRFTF